jgi:hypothetical protein
MTPEETPATEPEAPELTVPEYELTAGRRGLIMTFGRLEEHEGRLNDLPEQPDNFGAFYVRGTYAHVAKAANRLNEAQIRSGYLDYIYNPEPRKLTNA